MATATQLGKIGALVERVGALDNKQRGMRIEADEWNDLVGVVRGLLELEKAQEASLQSELEDLFAVKGHQHVGEIGLDDLDTDLRSRVGADGGGIATRQAIVDMQRKLDAIASEAARVTTITEQLQRDLDRSSTDDLERSSKLRGFEERFAGLENLRGLVTGLSGQVDGLKDGIDAVLELRGSLGGVDVAALGNRVADLETLGKNQLGVDGHPLPVKQLELAVKEIQDVLEVGGGSGLEERFNGLKTELAGALDDRLDTGLASAQTALDGKLEDMHGTLTAEIGTQVGAARGELESLVDARVAGARDGLDASLSAKLETASSDLRTAVTAEASAVIDARLSTLPTQIRDAATAAVVAMRPGLRDELAATIASEVDGRVVPLADDLRSRADALDKRFDERESQLPGLVRTVSADLLPSLVDARVAQAADALATTLGARIDQQLVQARDAILSSVQSQLPGIARDIIGDLDGRIGTQLDRRLADLDARIDVSVAHAVGDLTSRIDEAVKAQIAQLGLDQKLDALAAKLTEQLKGTIDKTRAEFQDALKSSIADALAQARAELARMRDSIVADFEGALEKTQETFKQQLDRGLAELWSKTQSAVAELRNAVNPRLDRLEKKVFGTSPTGVIGTNIATSVINPPPG